MKEGQLQCRYSSSHTGEENAWEMWKPVEGTHVQVTLPHLIYFPAKEGMSAMEKPHKPWEIHVFLPEQANLDEHGLGEQDILLMQKWLLVETQAQDGKNSSTLSMKVTPVMLANRAFKDWYFHHLSNVLRPQQPVPLAALAMGMATQIGATALSLSKMALWRGYPGIREPR